MLTHPAGLLILVCAFPAGGDAQPLRANEAAALEASGTSFAGKRPGDPHFIRFEMITRTLKKDIKGAIRMAEALQEKEGWQVYATARLRRLERVQSASGFELANLWSVLFALSLGIFVLGGGRQLLRPSMETLALLGLGGGTVIVGYFICPRYVIVLGFTTLVVGVLNHAAISSVRKVKPAARARVLFATVYFVGLFGLLGLLFTRVHLI